MGERQLNIRAMAEVQCSSVEEQVACLIDLATDANILGRTYQGWEPWVWTLLSSAGTDMRTPAYDANIFCSSLLVFIDEINWNLDE